MENKILFEKKIYSHERNYYFAVVNIFGWPHFVFTEYVTSNCEMKVYSSKFTSYKDAALDFFETVMKKNNQ